MFPKPPPAASIRGAVSTQFIGIVAMFQITTITIATTLTGSTLPLASAATSEGRLSGARASPTMRLAPSRFDSARGSVVIGTSRPQAVPHALRHLEELRSEEHTSELQSP